ncbi:DUF975 family protein [Streptococcaceae bacterium ESL0687]|nr:DUF975 family protein [Streptococcaceae bacterium ESL0687]
MKFKSIKREAKDFVNGNLKYSIILWSVTIVLSIMSTSLGAQVDVNDDSFYISVPSILSFLISIAIFITSNSANYVTLDNLRLGRPSGRPLDQQSEILQKKYFFPLVIINILVSIYIFLLTLLVVAVVAGLFMLFSYYNLNTFFYIIPVAIAILGWIFVAAKNLSYAQAANIYKDYIDQGIKISARESITKSKNLMAGHRFKLFLFSLSFILWFILVGLTLGLAIFYVLPYYRTSLQNFYLKLAPEKEALDLY